MRYTKYALGEIVLVVVGILIALQINDWYQDRVERQTETEYLISMKRDLTEDTHELRAAIDGNNHLLAGLDRTLQLLAEPRDDEVWRRAVYTHGIKHTYWFMVMEFSRRTMAELQYSGGLRLIRDGRVREAMISYEQGLETALKQHVDIMAYFHALEESNKALLNLTLSKQAMEFIEEDPMNMLQPIEVFESLIPQGTYFSNNDPSLLTDYYDDMLYYRTALNILTLMYKRQLQLAEALEALIEEQYGI